VNDYVVDRYLSVYFTARVTWPYVTGPRIISQPCRKSDSRVALVEYKLIFLQTTAFFKYEPTLQSLFKPPSSTSVEILQSNALVSISFIMCPF
jgi:hypothetical protein